MYKLILGDCKEKIKDIPDNSVHLILVDPPYQLGSFRKDIGKWEKENFTDSNMFNECNRVLIDGGHLLCFSSNRTLYEFGIAIKSANFEMRDTLIWKYKQSIPRNMDIGKAIDAFVTYGKTSSKYIKKIEQEFGGDSYKIMGTNNTMFGEKKIFERKEYNVFTEEGKKFNGFGTNLAPAYEPIIMARKPFKVSLAENCIKNEVGALNINKCKEITKIFPCNILEFKKEKKDKFNTHPMVKPIELLKYLIEMTTLKEQTVLDFTLGSGSTIVASEYTNRYGIGIERDEKYFEIAKKRLKNISY